MWVRPCLPRCAHPVKTHLSTQPAGKVNNSPSVGFRFVCALHAVVQWLRTLFLCSCLWWWEKGTGSEREMLAIIPQWSSILSASLCVTTLLMLKPVLYWANVCSPNILRTVRRTMIRLLIEHLVRRTWFGQFDELYFVLNWLVMRCKLGPELAVDAQQTAWSKM